MTTTASNRHTRTKPTTNLRKETEEVQEVTRDMVNYVTEYAREKPGYAALICIGVGFVLGWKLKPW